MGIRRSRVSRAKLNLGFARSCDVYSEQVAVDVRYLGRLVGRPLEPVGGQVCRAVLPELWYRVRRGMHASFSLERHADST